MYLIYASRLFAAVAKRHVILSVSPAVIRKTALAIQIIQILVLPVLSKSNIGPYARYIYSP